MYLIELHEQLCRRETFLSRIHLYWTAAIMNKISFDDANTRVNEMDDDKMDIKRLETLAGIISPKAYEDYKTYQNKAFKIAEYYFAGEKNKIVYDTRISEFN